MRGYNWHGNRHFFSLDSSIFMKLTTKSVSVRASYTWTFIKSWLRIKRILFCFAKLSVQKKSNLRKVFMNFFSILYRCLLHCESFYKVCFVSENSFLKYTYNIETKNLPSAVIVMWVSKSNHRYSHVVGLTFVLIPRWYRKMIEVDMW